MGTELEPSEVILQIISSLRNLDGRITEIKQAILNKHFTEDSMEPMKERMKKLLETRMQLIYTLLDEKLLFGKYLGEESDITYENLKRNI